MSLDHDQSQKSQLRLWLDATFLSVLAGCAVGRRDEGMTPIAHHRGGRLGLASLEHVHNNALWSRPGGLRRQATCGLSAGLRDTFNHQNRGMEP
ncbi:hypothetical protein [Acuticoccus kandeliae]|uniref:hypothetical protein n=1 Tax=Acuticoccus kandeliae TaxID=2073160 RepID=UPI0013002EA4|nr:hypothetical protein [Acuticoccus kandeliae]